VYVPGVKVDDVEALGLLKHAFYEQDVPREVIAAARIEPQRSRRDWNDFSVAGGVTAREERDLMPEIGELLDKICDDTFGPAVCHGRYALE
jgi:hypothetical protein